MAQAASSAPTTGRHQRKLKNYLLDPHFQLKYTAYLVAVTVALGGSLGVVVWQTSDQVVAQSQKNVEQGQRVVDLGREVVGESRKVSEVVKMNIVKDPVYQDNPALLEAFTTDAKKQDQRLQEQEAQLVAQAESLKRESRSLKAFQSRMMLTLAGVMLLLVVGIFVAGIVVTHKVAGPIFKMKRMIKDVGDGHLRIPGKLRKGDELVHFFDAFDQMVRNLRARQENEIAMLESAIAELEGKADAAVLKSLLDLKREMQNSLNV
ncbi:MAG TPA: HAMP domain-containing protein [Polyangiaceae bacterium]|nr:HAMP domain-containing protein [Polyangiaceae bacterium]